MSVRAMSWAIDQRGMSTTDKLLLLILADHSDNKGRCFPGLSRIAETMEVSRATVNRGLRNLRDLGLIEITPKFRPDGGQTSNTYRLCISDEGVCHPRHPTPVSDDTGPSSPVTYQEPSDEPSDEPSEEDPYSFEGEVIRLRAVDYRKWAAAFPNVNLQAELTSRDAWLATQPPGDQKRWFVSTSSYLAKLQRESGGNGKRRPAGYDEWGDPVDESGIPIHE